MGKVRITQSVWLPLYVLLFVAVVGEASLSAQNAAENAVIPDAVPVPPRQPEPKGEERVARFLVSFNEEVITVRHSNLPDDDAETLRPFENVLVAPRRRYEIDPGAFDDLVFGKESTAGVARDNFYRILRQRIGVIDQVCRLTDAQRNKLELAGRGDIKRFFDRVEGLRHKFFLPYITDAGIRDMATRVTELAQETLPLRQRVRDTGLFSDGSLFSKILRGIATATQIDQILAREAIARAPRQPRPRM